MEIIITNQDTVQSAGKQRPPTCGLMLNTIPDDAAIKFLGSSRTYTPGMQLQPGKYRVEISQEGYATITRIIEIVATDVVLTVELVELSYGLIVNPTPADATIKILMHDRRYHPGIKLCPGVYKIEVAKHSYKPIQKWVEIIDKNIAIDINLTQISMALTIQPTPIDAQIRLLDWAVPYHSGIRLPSGKYQVEVMKTGYATHRREITIDNSDVTTPIVLTLLAATSKKLNNEKNHFPDLPKVSKFVPINGKKAVFCALAIGLLILIISGCYHYYMTTKTQELAQTRWQDPITEMDFVWVPNGCFRMGTSQAPNSDEAPSHQVCISDGFWLGTYEITQKQWLKVMGTNPSQFKYGGNYPVEQISWDDLQIFIKKLNAQSQHTFRLPLEAEWEYACRSGGKWEWHCGGKSLEELAWYFENAKEKTSSVGKKRPNGLGLYDMSGNVSEWVHNWYGKYPKKSVTNPSGPASGGIFRVHRGGSWNSDMWFCRSGFRFNDLPSIRYSSLGARLVRISDEQQSMQMTNSNLPLTTHISESEPPLNMQPEPPIDPQLNQQRNHQQESKENILHKFSATKIELFLAQAESELNTTPLKAVNTQNAKARFQYVLLLEPNNSRAKQGLQKIIKHYKVQAEQAMLNADLEKARALLDQAIAIKTIIESIDKTDKIVIEK